MPKLLFITLIHLTFLGNVNSQTLIEHDSLKFYGQLKDSVELAKPSEEYSKQLLVASKSDCFCSDRVYFRVTVEVDGELSDISLIKGTGTCWDDVLKKSIKNSSPWIPASKNGVATKTTQILPIHYGTVITYPCSSLEDN